jgi:hypothetical protein
VHEERLDAALALPGELLLARPVAMQTDLDVALRRDEARFDEVDRKAAGLEPRHPAA